MKNRLLFISIIILQFSLTESVAQINSYFLNNPVWKMSWSFGGDNNCITSQLYNYYTNGDTTFNSLVYKKIFKKGENEYHCPNTFPPSNPVGYIDTTPSYFLRSTGKKMFLRKPVDTSEYLLYDFNLEVGDTLPLTYNNNLSDIVVDSIDSIYTPFGYRKKFNIAGGCLIEGIGSSVGLVESINISSGDLAYKLDCFSLNDTAYYPNIGPSCNMKVGIDSYNKVANYSIYPNPFNASTTIKFSSITNIEELIIYNIYGQALKVMKNISGEIIIIERESLKNGIYFIKLLRDNEINTLDKLIITD